MKKTLHLTSALFVATLFVLSGCGAKSGGAAYEAAAAPQAAYDNGAELARADFEGAGFNQSSAEFSGDAAFGADGTAAAGGASNPAAPAGSSAENSGAAKERKLVKRAELNIEAEPSFVDAEGRLSGVNQKVDELLKQYGAYAERTQSEENYISFTIRVPRGNYDALIAGAGVLGKVRSHSETAEDVTLRYYDVEGRLNTKKTLLATFQNYLSQTKNIDDIMKVETRIAELQNEIDWLGTELTQLANLVDYATVELSVFSSRRQTSYTLGDRVGRIFGGFGDFATSAVVALVGIVVYGVPILLVCLLAFWILFGRIGLLRKAFRLVTRGKEQQKEKQS
jgi:hypothetical protein